MSCRNKKITLYFIVGPTILDKQRRGVFMVESSQLIREIRVRSPVGTDQVAKIGNDRSTDNGGVSK